MAKSPDAFRTISEVATWLGTQAHVLRFWESKFGAVSPVQRAGGRRYYRQTDMKVLGGIKFLLHEKGMPIKAVQKLFNDKGTAYVQSFSPEMIIMEPANISRKLVHEDIFSDPVKSTHFSDNKSANAPEYNRSVSMGEALENENQLILFPEMELENVAAVTTTALSKSQLLKPTEATKLTPLSVFGADLPKIDSELVTFLGQVGPVTKILRFSTSEQCKLMQVNPDILVQLQQLHKKLGA